MTRSLSWLVSARLRRLTTELDEKLSLGPTEFGPLDAYRQWPATPCGIYGFMASEPSYSKRMAHSMRDRSHALTIYSEFVQLSWSSVEGAHSLDRVPVNKFFNKSHEVKTEVTAVNFDFATIAPVTRSPEANHLERNECSPSKMSTIFQWDRSGQSFDGMNLAGPRSF